MGLCHGSFSGKREGGETSCWYPYETQVYTIFRFFLWSTAWIKQNWCVSHNYLAPSTRHEMYKNACKTCSDALLQNSFSDQTLRPWCFVRGLPSEAPKPSYNSCLSLFFNRASRTHDWFYLYRHCLAVATRSGKNLTIWPERCLGTEVPHKSSPSRWSTEGRRPARSPVRGTPWEHRSRSPRGRSTQNRHPSSGPRPRCPQATRARNPGVRIWCPQKQENILCERWTCWPMGSCSSEKFEVFTLWHTSLRQASCSSVRG